MNLNPNDVGILTSLLNIFIAVFSGGAVRLADDAMDLMRGLMSIEVTLLGIWFVFSRETQVVVLVAKVMAFGTFTYLIQAWPMLTRALVNSFIAWGLKAGGDGISVTDFTDPSNIVVFGMSVTAVVFAHLNEYAGIDALKNIVEILFSGFTAMATTLTYVVLGLWIFVTLLEFYAVSTLAVILLPCGIFSKTAFLAEKALSGIFASAVQVLTLSFITGATLPVMVRLQTTMNPAFKDVLQMLVGALALLAIAWRANRFALTILHGTPHLSVQDVAQTITTIINTVTTVGRAASAGAQAVAPRRR